MSWDDAPTARTHWQRVLPTVRARGSCMVKLSSLVPSRGQQDDTMTLFHRKTEILELTSARSAGCCWWSSKKAIR